MSGRWYRDVYSDAVWECESLKSQEKAVAETYARHAHDKDGNKSAAADLAWITYVRLMAKAGIGRRASVSAAVASLVESGWLEPVQQVSRRATVYRLTIPVAGSSDGGTTEPDSRGSDGGTTVVPLSESGSSTFPSGSSDGGTQPLGPLKELTTNSLSAREASTPEHLDVEDRERDESASLQEPKNERRGTAYSVLALEGVTDDEADRFIAWANRTGHKGGGWYRTVADNGDLTGHVEAFRAEAGTAASCPDCEDTGEVGDWMNRRACDCLWWKDPAAARKAFVPQLKDFAPCEHGKAGGDVKAPNGWQLCPECRGPGWVDLNEQGRTDNGGPHRRRSPSVLRAEQALDVADRLDRQFGHGKYAKGQHVPYFDPPNPEAYKHSKI